MICFDFIVVCFWAVNLSACFGIFDGLDDESIYFTTGFQLLE